MMKLLNELRSISFSIVVYDIQLKINEFRSFVNELHFGGFFQYYLLP